MGLGYRHPPAFAQGPLLLPADALATLSQEGEARASGSPLGRRRTGPQAGPGQSRSQLLAGGRLRLHQCGDVERSSGEPRDDRPLALEGGAVRDPRATAGGTAGSAAEEGGAVTDPQGDDRGRRDKSRRDADYPFSQSGSGAAGPGDPRRPLVSWLQVQAGDGGAGSRPVGTVAG